MIYTVCQIKGRQYLIKPGQVFEVDKLPAELKTLQVEQVLLEVNDDKVEIGSPVLKKTLNFEVLETVKKPKIRVMKFHAKANYRKTTGSRAQKTRIKLVEGKNGK